MYETFWLAFFGFGVLTCVVSFAGYDPLTTIASALGNLFIWSVLAYGATDLLTEQAGTTSSTPVAYLCFGIALASLAPLVLGFYEWWVEEGEDEQNSLQDMADNIQ